MKTKQVLLAFMTIFLLNCSSDDEPEYMSSEKAKLRIEGLAQKYGIPAGLNENTNLDKLSEADFAELERMLAGLSLIPGTYSMTSERLGEGYYSSSQTLKRNRKKRLTRAVESGGQSSFTFDPKDMSPYPYIMNCKAVWYSINNGDSILSAFITPSLTYLPPYDNNAIFDSFITNNDCLWRTGGNDSICFDGRVNFEIVYESSGQSLFQVPLDYIGQCSRSKGSISWAMVYH